VAKPNSLLTMNVFSARQQSQHMQSARYAVDTDGSAEMVEVKIIKFPHTV